MKSILICPVCGRALEKSGGCRKCEAGHSFDISKEGYVNLLIRGGSADSGDNLEMTKSRTRFLNAGYYAPLAEALAGLIPKKDAAVLDICCGDGYYTKALAESAPGNAYYGFDISKNMIKTAAKRKITGAEFFIANLSSIPIATESVDFAIHLFAPFGQNEFYRIMKHSGTLISVIPGKNHLYGMKKALYGAPYYNGEKLPDAALFRLAGTKRVAYTMTIEDKDSIAALYGMTPYCYNTSKEDAARLLALDRLETEAEFILAIYEKR